MKVHNGIVPILTLAAAFFALRSFAFAQAASAGAATPPGAAAPSNEELAKMTENPIANLISVPFQENANLNYGRSAKTQSVLDIEPVIPIELNKDWNLITRTTLPVMSQPGLQAGDDRINGIGDLQVKAFLTPGQPGSVVWGAGVIVQAPTHSNSQLGNDHWGVGPQLVVIHLDKASPWVYGVQADNVWSVGSASGPSYNNGSIKPFLNYNFHDGTHIGSGPQITVNWKANSSQRWTVPIGGGIGHVFRLGKLPVSMVLSVYYNVVRPDNAGNWQIQPQVTFLFPK
jgi:hypothetical protein